MHACMHARHAAPALNFLNCIQVQVETDDTDGRETEFQKLKLRKSEGGTPSNAGKTRSATVNTHDFGVKLKVRL